MAWFDFLTDGFETVFDFLVDAATTVYEAISDAVSWLADGFVTFFTALGEYWDEILVAAVAAVAVYYYPAYAVLVIAAVDAIGYDVPEPAYYIAAVISITGAYLTAIKLTTLQGINFLAGAISKEYRQIYGNILGITSRVSALIGLGAEFIPMMIENARLFVLDSAAFVGIDYDLAQVRWLSQLTDYLERFAGKMDVYQSNPIEAIWDLNELIIGPAHHEKATFQLGLLTSIDGTIQAVDKLIGNFDRVNDSFYRLLATLPDKIKVFINPAIFDVNRRIATFIQDDYRPVVGHLDTLIATLTDQHSRTRTDLGMLAHRLTKPGTYLAEVDALPASERVEQVNTIAEIATRPQRESADAIAGALPAVEEDLARVRDALIPETPAPTILTFELRPTGRLVPQAQGARVGWFVGDY